MAPQNEHYYMKAHPFHSRGYQIFRGAHGQEGQPIGEYIVMDKSERPEVTHAKIEALTASLNHQNGDVAQNGQQDNPLISFQRIGAKSDSHVPEQIIFYKNNYRPEGGKTREINAIMTLAKGETHT